MNSACFKPDIKVRAFWNFVNVFFLIMVFVAIWVMFLGGMELLGCLAIGIAWIVVIYIPFAIYIPAFFLSLEYCLDNDALRLKKGVFWRRVTTVPYAKITNIDITQGPVERMFRISHLHIQTAGFSGNQAYKAELVLVGITDAEGLKEQIMQKLKARAAGSESPAIVPISDSQLLQGILDELVGIRRELSQKS